MSPTLLLQKTGKILVILLFLFQNANTQDFTIIHDLQKDSSSFYKFSKSKDSVAVSEISFKKPGRINLKVENFNPFYWNAQVTTFKRPVDEESGHIGMFISTLTSVLGVSGFPATRGGADPKVQKRLLEVYSQLEESGLQLQELKFNIQKSEKEIKSDAQKIGANVLNLIGKDKLELKELRSKGKELDDSLGMQMENPFSELIPVVGKLYNDIMNTDYKFYYSIKGNTEINELKLQIYPRSDSMARENPRDTITKYFALRDKTILKLMNSVGISFTYFRDNNTSYYINPDLTIGIGSADLFTPIISTFINIYGNRNNGLRLGGSFGFGIPITSVKKEINFMLGLSTVLGRNELIIISAGFAGAKVERLANGWKVGQIVPHADFIIPTISQFRPGGYISLAFNLKSLSNKQ